MSTVLDVLALLAVGGGLWAAITAVILWQTGRIPSAWTTRKRATLRFK